MESPRTLIEAVRFFSNLDTCQKFMVDIKWPSGEISCPNCGGREIGQIASRRKFQCKSKGCRKQFSVKVGTIFEDSPLGLDKWLVCVWCITNDKNGISSYEVALALGVTQKTAWFMLHRVRVAMAEDKSDQLSGVCESDETMIGGLSKNMHKDVRARKITGTGSCGKTIVHGILQRGDDDTPSQVRVKVVPNQKRKTLHAEIQRNVTKGITVYTDRLKSYEGLDAMYVHDMVDHAIEYVRGEVHTQRHGKLLVAAQAIVERHLRCRGPEASHAILCRIRFNERVGNDASRFSKVMQSVPGKRLMYKQLTEKTEAIAGC